MQAAARTCRCANGRTRAVWALMLGASMCSGCSEGWQRMRSWFGRAEANAGTTAATNPPADTAGAARIATVRFNVLRVEAPEGGLQRISDIWRMVNTDVLSPSVATMVQDNGFMVGVGDDRARIGVRAQIDRLHDVRGREEQALPQAGKALELLITEAERDLTVFFALPGGRTAGQSFEEARPVLRIGWDIEPPRLDDVVIHIEPEIRQPQGPRRYQQAGDRWQFRPEYRGRIFRELSFEVTVPKGGFLLLGPTPDVHRVPLVARPFFIEPVEGRLRESLIVITPLVEWSNVARDVDLRSAPPTESPPARADEADPSPADEPPSDQPADEPPRAAP